MPEDKAVPTKAMERVLKRGEEAVKRLEENNNFEAELQPPVTHTKETKVRTTDMAREKMIALA